MANEINSLSELEDFVAGKRFVTVPADFAIKVEKYDDFDGSEDYVCVENDYHGRAFAPKDLVNQLGCYKHFGDAWSRLVYVLRTPIEIARCRINERNNIA